MTLNLLSSAAMVRMGRVYDNWMVHVALTNAKLRRRGAQILEDATGAEAASVERALRESGYNLPAALVMLKAGATAEQARRALAAANDNVRQALKLLDTQPHPKRLRER
jgi:N-acetylmuramic acid 6-phosphate etherase